MTHYHIVGQEGGGLVVDAVAMSVKDARALAHGHITLAQIQLKTT
jgi:hypothetical protein